MKRKWFLALFAIILMVFLGCNRGCTPEPPTGDEMEYSVEYETLPNVQTPATYNATLDVKSEFLTGFLTGTERLNVALKAGVEEVEPAMATEEAEGDEPPTESIFSKMQVVDQLAPNIFVVGVYMSAEIPVPVNSISMVIKYDTTVVTMLGDVTINEKIYYSQLNPDFPHVGNTIYKQDAGYPEDDYNSMRLSFFTLDNLELQELLLFTFVVEVDGNTAIRFSDIPGWLEYTDLTPDVYPGTHQDIKFFKVSE